MTVNTETNRIDFIADGIQTVFPYNYPVYVPSWMTVFLDGVQQFAGFTVNGAVPGGTNGDVTFDVAPADEVQVTLLRELPLLQLLDYTPFDPFPAESSEESLDENIMIDQQLLELIGRSPLAPVGDPCTDWTIDSADDRRDRFVVYEDTDAACGGVSDFSVTDVANLLNSDVLKTSISVWLGGAPLADSLMGGYVFDRSVVFPAGLGSSRGYAEVPPTAPFTVTLIKNALPIGTVNWATGISVATFTMLNDETFVAGDRMLFEAPSVPDASFADIMMTIQGERPT